MDALGREVEYVRSIVGRVFPVYDVRLHGDVLSIFINVDKDSVETKFDGLRRELVPQGYIPFLTHQGGEYAIHMRKRPTSRFRGPKLNVVLLGITIFTTVLSGMSLWAGYVGIQDYTTEFWQADVVLRGGLFFALPLLAILGTHEMSHYLMAKKHGVAASLPFFLPAPPIIGTFGALISMRDPIPNKKALVDIGISGPLGGLAVAIPVTALGLHLGNLYPGVRTPNTGGGLSIGSPLLFELLSHLVPSGGGFVHPTAFAGWVGLFVTALNLLPAGQLDGGHVARALLGDRGRFLSYASIAAMLGLAYFYTGWIFLAVFILLLGPRHPPPLDDVSKLKIDRKLLGSSAAVVMALCFIAVPFTPIAEVRNFVYTTSGGASQITTLSVTLAGPGDAVFGVNNTGNVLLSVNLTFGQNASQLAGQGWQFSFVQGQGQKVNANGTNLILSLNATEAATVVVHLVPPSLPSPSGPFLVDVVGLSDGDPPVDSTLRLEAYVP